MATTTCKEWQYKELSEVADFRMGKTPPRKENKYWEEGRYYWVSIADMTPFGTITDTKEKVSEYAHNKLFRGRLSPKDTVLMSFKLTIGRTSKLAVDSYHNEAIVSIFPKNEIENDFLFYYLPTINFLNHQDTAVKGKTLNKSKIARLPIPIPPLSEQKAIVRVLTTVQEAIAGQEALIAKLKELKRSMMHHLFTHGTRGEKTKITEIGEIPESWEVVRIKFFGQIITGTTPSTKVPDYYGGPYKLVSPADLTDNLYIETSQKTLTEAGLNAARKVPKNSVLVGCIGNVGKIGITHDEVTAFNQQINAIVVNDRFDFLFVYYLIYFYRHVLESKASKVTVPILNKSNFENIELAAPELKEQIRIAQALYSVDRKIEFIKMKLSVYQNLFKTLLHELMSGGRRIKFYEKEIK